MIVPGSRVELATVDVATVLCSATFGAQQIVASLSTRPERGLPPTVERFAVGLPVGVVLGVNAVHATDGASGGGPDAFATELKSPVF